MNQPAAYSIKEEIANSLSHGIGAILSVIALVMLVGTAIAEKNSLKIISFTIYGISLFLLFSASTIYHAVRNSETKKLFKLLDHCAIYLLIAGTYTPLMMITLKGPLGYAMTAIIWTIALLGVCFKITFGHRFKKLSLCTYLGMGFIALAILPQLNQQLDMTGLILLALGGLIYSSGVIFYVNKKIPFNHAIWHLFVLGGALSHFFMIWLYVG